MASRTSVVPIASVNAGARRCPPVQSVMADFAVRAATLDDFEARPRDHRRRPRSLKVTCTEEAVADLVEAITYLNERSPTAAANLDAEIARCTERLADLELQQGFRTLSDGTRNVAAIWNSLPCVVVRAYTSHS